MAKTQTIFVCGECGYETPRWLGKCPACTQWNTFVEEKIDKATKTVAASGTTITPIQLNTISSENCSRVSTGYSEFDRVLGGGLVSGSLVLIGGDPGIGKSTLLLQMCNKVDSTKKVLYVSGEESASQVKLRADRISVFNDNILFLGETDLSLIENVIDNIKPDLIILDSIQTIYSPELTSAPGSVSQVREVTSRVMNIAKKQQITTLIIGHVTKEGSIAGPRVLEHIVDTVLYLEGERFLAYRILRAVKNRFGSTNEIGIFEMKEEGMVEITDPSGILLSESPEKAPGSVIVASLEGTRPIIVEIQALVVSTPFGMPRRMATGIDYNRLVLLMAVLEKRCGFTLHNNDAYVNVIGGLKLDEPAVDLGVLLAIASSYKNRNLRKDTVIIGEVGLTGEIRSVNQIEKRINEIEKTGFKSCIIPESNAKMIKGTRNIEIIAVNDINKALEFALEV